MSFQIEVIEKETEYTLEINEIVPMWKMPMIIGSSYKAIAEYLGKKGLECIAAPYVRYIDLNWNELNNENKFFSFIKMVTKKWNMLIGFPVKEKTEGEGNIKAGIIEKGKFVKAVHRGPYQKVGDTYKLMTAYIKKENLKIKNESIEYYLNDPKTTKKEDLETTVLIPIA